MLKQNYISCGYRDECLRTTRLLKTPCLLERDTEDSRMMDLWEKLSWNLKACDVTNLYLLYMLYLKKYGWVNQAGLRAINGLNHLNTTRIFITLASPLKTYPIGVTYAKTKSLWITYPKIYLCFLTFKQKLWEWGVSFLFFAVIEANSRMSGYANINLQIYSEVYFLHFCYST